MKNKKKKKQAKKKKSNKTPHYSSLSSLPVASSLILVALGAAVCHSVYSFVQTYLFVNAHCVICGWLVSRLWYAINTRPLSRLFLDIVLLTHMMEIVQVRFNRISPFQVL